MNNTDPSSNNVYTLQDNSGNSYTISPTFVWEIRKIEAYPIYNNLPNVVKNIHWTYSTTVIINDISYFGYFTDIAKLPPPESDKFIPFDNVSKKDIEGWLDETVDLTQTKNIVISNLQNNFSPPIITLPIPE